MIYTYCKQVQVMILT